MSNNKISYLNRTFDDYKESLKKYVEEYYPQIANDFDDASIGSWLIDLVAAVGDNLSFYIDKAYNETNLETATQASSVYNIARSNGFKIPGPKGSMAEVKFSCIVPVAGENNSSSSLGMPDMDYAPIIKRGTKVTSKSQTFEVMDDIDFSEQFNKNGVSNREIIPVSDTNGKTNGYRITKTDVVVAGETKVYKQVLNTSDITPFMEIILPDTNVMNIESIIFKDGSNFKKDPSNGEFLTDKESYSKDNVQIYRFFEVDALTDQYRWGDDTSNAKAYTYGYNVLNGDANVPCYSITKGKWAPITQKFITEFTDKGYLKIIFGSGEQAGQKEEIYSGTTSLDFSQYQISRMVRNNFLGKLPKAGWTMYVLYRTGGGAASNVAKGTITNISYLDANIGKLSYTCDSTAMQKISDVKNSLRVTNTTPSISGKDAPSIEEIKAMIKYHNASQNRCVTTKDYEDRIALMPPKYGCPFRYSAIEENNKIKIFMLGINNEGKLSNVFPEMLISNISDYLSKYRMVNDYVVIEGGEIVHLSFEANIFVDKNYNSGDVAYSVIQTIKDYMDINKHKLGEDIFVGEIEKQINDLDGVLNLIELKIYNKYRTDKSNIDYSFSRIAQDVKEVEDGRAQVLLSDTNYVLNSNVDTMFEILNPDIDISVKMIAR